jgi:threonine dehydratase/peptide deformylase
MTDTPSDTAPEGLLPILVEGDPRLAEPARPVDPDDPALPRLLRRLHATLADFRARHGFGRAMAAPQAGVPLRIVVMNLGAGPFALLDPRITRRSTETIEVWDDCLSVPGRCVKVLRHRSIDLVYRDERGRERRWTDLPPDLAELVQHELDHLDGVLMTARAHGADAIRPLAERPEGGGVPTVERRLSLDRIAAAAARLPAEFRDTPQYDCEPLSEALGCRLTIKVETANPIRSFKGRGASVLVDALAAAGERGPVVCASAGNWGQAVAYAARRAGLPTVVYASVNANPLKVARMAALGAEVRREGEDFDAAKAAARAWAAAAGTRWVEDGREAEVAEGHGSIAVELLARGDAFDHVLVPLGNGAMLAGIARWLKAASPATRVVGVCARGAPSMADSLREGRVVETARADTIADGFAVRVPVPEALEDLRGLVDEVLRVDDADIVTGMRLALAHAGLLLEPSGAVGLAALVAHRARFEGTRVATVLCGGNLADADRVRLLGEATG